ncbi:EpsG family protein [Cereibacter johrii]|uniref:EpsG family protein n=1 Tax=Cereibacter johrii TaxID=445629 RepID=UPI002B1F6575|nr:EpsG family protein [Cereibacter johrii]MEA5163506.1 EpsG family protein [Cereibacter johrii]
MVETVHLIYYGVILAAGLSFLAIQSLHARLDRPLLTFPIVALVSLAVSLRDIRFGADTRVYLEMYKSPDDFEDFVEIAYITALRLLRLISEDGTFYLFVSALATNLTVYLAFVRFNPRLAAFAFVLYCATPVFWAANTLILRNGLAAAFILYAAMILVTAGRTKVFFAFALAGGTFHYSALVHAGFLSIANLSTVKRFVISVATLILAALSLVYIFPLFSGILDPWIKRFLDYQYYASTGQFAYDNDGFRPQYAIPVLSVLGALLLWTRLRSTEMLLFKYYLALVMISAVFWGNILFRDRIYLPAQMMEPLIIAFLIRRAVKDNSMFVMAGTAIVLMLAAVSILIWAPRNVLRIY